MIPREDLFQEDVTTAPPYLEIVMDVSGCTAIYIERVGCAAVIGRRCVGLDCRLADSCYFQMSGRRNRGVEGFALYCTACYHIKLTTRYCESRKSYFSVPARTYVLSGGDVYSVLCSFSRRRESTVFA